MLQFKKYKIEIEKNKFLQLDFEIKTGEIFSLISDREEILEQFKLSLLKTNGYDGEIILNGEDINKNSILFEDTFGFYPKFSLNKNFKSLLSMFKIKLDDNLLQKQFRLLNLDGEKSYKDLLANEKTKVKILFLFLMKEPIIVVESYKNKLTALDKEGLYSLIEQFEFSKTAIIILDTTLNYFSELAENVLVLSNGEQSYSGSLQNLLIIKKLVAITLDYAEDLDIVLQNYEYTELAENEIVVREEVLEDVIYELLKNDLEVLQIRNLGEKIKLYVEEIE